MMNEYFYDLVSSLTDILQEPYIYTATFSGENSNFVRFNRAQIRQAGSVEQFTVQVDVIKGLKHSLVSLSLGGNISDDKSLLKTLVERAKSEIDFFEEDPFLFYATTVNSTESIETSSSVSVGEVTDAILQSANGLDFVGIHAQGLTHRGFANSFGQRNFVTRETFNTDFSLYLSADKAVKSNVAGKKWEASRFISEVEKCKKMLGVLSRPAKTIERGNYRAFLSPSAVNEVMSLLSWGAFSEKQGQTKSSALMQLRIGEKSLHPSVHVVENTSSGIGAPFQSGGFMRPAKTSLIHEGKWVNGLVSPRTAKEYGIDSNGANANESPESLEVGAGTLESDRVLETLDTGVMINNLWYLNFSDRTKCQMTGMTRFATFWVEKGEIIAPINVMRFDDSVYRLFGSQLEALTKDRAYMLDQSTYEERSTHSTHLPGALVNEIAFTL